MKTLKMNYVLLTVLLIGLQCMYAGSRNINCLEVSLAATFHKSILENCRVTLLQENEVTETLDKPNRGNRYKFSLKSNTFYTLIITCEGYHPRKISINTAIPDSINLAMIYEFIAKVEMIPVTVMLRGEFDDHPVAMIEYDQKNDVFNMNKKYTQKIKKVMFQPTSPDEEKGIVPEY